MLRLCPSLRPAPACARACDRRRQPRVRGLLGEVFLHRDVEAAAVADRDHLRQQGIAQPVDRVEVDLSRVRTRRRHGRRGRRRYWHGRRDYRSRTTDAQLNSRLEEPDLPVAGRSRRGVLSPASRRPARACPAGRVQLVRGRRQLGRAIGLEFASGASVAAGSPAAAALAKKIAAASPASVRARRVDAGALGGTIAQVTSPSPGGKDDRLGRHARPRAPARLGGGSRSARRVTPSCPPRTTPPASHGPRSARPAPTSSSVRWPARSR